MRWCIARVSVLNRSRSAVSPATVRGLVRLPPSSSWRYSGSPRNRATTIAAAPHDRWSGCTNSCQGAGASGIGRAPARPGPTPRGTPPRARPARSPRSTAWATTRRWSRSRASPRRTQDEGRLAVLAQVAGEPPPERDDAVLAHAVRRRELAAVPTRRHDLLGEDALGQEQPAARRGRGPGCRSGRPGRSRRPAPRRCRRGTAARWPRARRRAARSRGGPSRRGRRWRPPRSGAASGRRRSCRSRRAAAPGARAVRRGGTCRRPKGRPARSPARAPGHCAPSPPPRLSGCCHPSGPRPELSSQSC